MVPANTPLQEFEFIVSVGPQIPGDPKIRTIIRKQAMRDVVVKRKKRGSSGRVSSIKYRVLDSGTNASERTVTLKIGASRDSASLDSRNRAGSLSLHEVLVMFRDDLPP
jgi:hypothetical protein